MAKPGLDGHDRGIKVLASAYRDAGMEVIYLGLRQTPEMIVSAAIQEDADVIALSVLSGAHMTVFPKVMDLMIKNEIDDVLLTGGGIISDKDKKSLANLGVGQLFGPGTPVQDTVDYIINWVQKNRR
tara:strand:- start:49 stop:429 length:381 start_codon:yes stop_codon:yes gene_type:complete